MSHYFSSDYLEGASYHADESDAYCCDLDEMTQLEVLLHRDTGIKVWAQALDLRSASGDSPVALFYHYTSDEGFGGMVSNYATDADAYLHLLADSSAPFGRGLYVSAKDGKSHLGVSFCVPVLIPEAFLREGFARQVGDASEPNWSGCDLWVVDLPEDIESRIRAADDDARVTLCRQRVQWASQTHGSSSTEALVAMEGLSFLLQSLGHHEEVASVLQRILQAREEAFGAAHPDTLAAMGDLALAFRDLIRDKEAEALLRKAMQAWADSAQEPGEQRLDAAFLRCQLAVLLLDLGRPDEAAELLGVSLGALRDALGDAHPQTQTLRSHLASALRELGRPREAESLCRRVLEARMEALGPSHPDTLASQGDVAVLLHEAGRRAEALQQCRSALEGKLSAFGWNHNSTAVSMSHLALLLHEKGDQSQAAAHCKRALKVQEATLGPLHNDTLCTFAILATLSKSDEKAKCEDVEANWRSLLQARESSLGAAHPSTLAAVSGMSMLLHGAGRLRKAEILCRKAVTTAESALGRDHWVTAHVLSNLAVVLQDMGCCQEAESFCRNALETSGEQLGPDHPMTLTTQANLALLLHDLHRRNEAEGVCRGALAALEATSPGAQQCAATVAACGTLSLILQSAGQLREAENLCRRTLRDRAAALGDGHPHTAISRNNLAALLAARNCGADAEEHCRRALDVLEEALGPQHHWTLTALCNLAALVERSGRSAPEDPLCRRVLPPDWFKLTGLPKDLRSSLGKIAAAACAPNGSEAADTRMSEAIRVLARKPGDRTTSHASRPDVLSPQM